MTPVRLLLVELDQDDPTTRALARELRDGGAEVVYTSARTADEVVVAAAQEDVRAVGFTVRTDPQRALAAAVAGRGIVVFATAESDEPVLLRAGVTAVFPPESGEQVLTWAEKQT